MRIAVDEIHAFLLENEMQIYLVVFDTKATMLGEKLYPDLEAYIAYNYVKDKREEEYGTHLSNAQLIERRTRRNTERADFSTGALPTYAEAPKVAKPSLKDSVFKKSAKKAAPIVQASMTKVDECQEDSYFDFEEQHESKLEERMKHTSDTFSQYLMYLIQDKKMENAEVYKRAIVDKKIFSKIKNNIDYHPQKLTALCLCVGAKLNLDEAKDLLARAGYALSPCDKTDIIFSYFIENEIYDMIELDIQLEEHGLPCIIS